MKKYYVGLLVIVFMLLIFSGCSKKAAKVEPVGEPVVEKVDEKTAKMDKPELTEEEIFRQKSLEALNKEGALIKIHFDFDKYTIRDDMKGNLHKNADFLLKHKTAYIIIEGHCDERGTAEYNMALGEKRAEATNNYLQSLGVTGDRIQTISYGKNKPAVSGFNEQTYYQNRRAEFVITKK